MSTVATAANPISRIGAKSLLVRRFSWRGRQGFGHCGESKTQERIAFTLKNGKPLRNEISLAMWSCGSAPLGLECS